MVHKIALKTLTTATRDPREVRTKANGRVKESQADGIEDPEVAARPI